VWRLRWLTNVLFSIFVVVGSSASASPIAIEYVATDLVDVDPGTDLWQYAYYVSDFDFLQDQGFIVSFELGLFEHLQDPVPAPNGDWDPLTLQPDTELLSGGFYDALARNDHASLSDAFLVRFVWLGGVGTQPGSQLFDVYETVAGSDDLKFIESGETVQRVPDPPSLLVVVTALAFSGALTRRFRS
jgi:hypothetical protein